MSKEKPGRMPVWYAPPSLGKGVTVEGWPNSVTGPQEECPSLGEVLSGSGDPADGGRAPMKISIFIQHGSLQVAIQDEHNSRSGFCTLRGDGTLGELIQRALEHGSFDWRPWGQHKKR